METHCPVCNTLLAPQFKFCPQCGIKLETVTAMPMGKQIQVYLVSLLFPPLGLIPGFKYLFYKNASAKRVGIIAIVLTIIATGITFWYAGILMNQINSALNSQLQQYNYLK